MSRVTYCAEGGPQLLRCPGPAGVTREEDGAAVGIEGWVGGCGGGEEEMSGSLGEEFDIMQGCRCLGLAFWGNCGRFVRHKSVVGGKEVVNCRSRTRARIIGGI